MNKHDGLSNHTITTKDLHFSACLKVLGYEFVGAERSGDDKVWFTFKSDTDDINQIQDEYYLNDITVGASTYGIAWKTLRKVMDRV
jgi:hypothetical protein